VHGQAGSKSQSTIYVSPSKEVAAFPTYSDFFPLNPLPVPEGQVQGVLPDEVTNKYAQIVFEVKVKPSSYIIQRSTLGQNRHWPRSLRVDKSFHTHCDLEHLIENTSDLMLSAILVRQFGPGAAPLPAPMCNANAEVLANFHHPRNLGKGPQFHWTFLREEAYKKATLNSVQVNHTAYFRDDKGRVVASLPGEKSSGAAHSISFKHESKEVTVQLPSPSDANILGQLLLAKDPSFFYKVVQANAVHIDSDQQIEQHILTCKLIDLKTSTTPRLPSLNTTPAAATPSAATPAAATPSAITTEAEFASSVAKPLSSQATRSSQPVFLGLERQNIDRVRMHGYSTCKRRNIAVSLTIDDARKVCLLLYVLL